MFETKLKPSKSTSNIIQQMFAKHFLSVKHRKSKRTLIHDDKVCMVQYTGSKKTFLLIQLREGTYVPQNKFEKGFKKKKKKKLLI